VLIVDDDAKIREILARWIGPAGHVTREAADADSALAEVNANPPDVVLCDVRMPERDGLWLVDRLREQHPTVAIVLATALDSVPPAVSLRDGVVEYIVKPFEREGVLAAVERASAWRATAQAEGGHNRRRASVDQWMSGSRSGSWPGPRG
jgi:DNA-binding NtrC family response regulator